MRVTVTCKGCNNTYERESRKVSGEWRCRPCTESAFSARDRRPIGALRPDYRYGYVEIKTENGWRRRSRCVMEKHIGRPLAKYERVRHINGKYDDDRLENLMLVHRNVSVSMTQKGAKRTGQALQNIRDAVSSRSYVKLNHAQAASIRLRAKAGHTQRAIARDLKVSPMTVNRVINGKRWKSAGNGWQV